MYLVFAWWDGDVSYGVDRATHLLGIFNTEEDAMTLIQKYAKKENAQSELYGRNNYFEVDDAQVDHLEVDFNISEGQYNNGSYTVSVEKFVPGMFTGGGWYLE